MSQNRPDAAPSVPTVPSAPASSLTPAAESADAAVHDLLARRQVALANDDTKGAAEIDAELAKLGLR